MAAISPVGEVNWASVTKPVEDRDLFIQHCATEILLGNEVFLSAAADTVLEIDGIEIIQERAHELCSDLERKINDFGYALCIEEHSTGLCLKRGLQINKPMY